MPAYNPLSNSTFLDAFGANLYSAQQYQDVAGNTAAADATLAQLFNYGQYPASVSHAAVDGSRCHSTLSRGATAETPNQSDMPRSSAMETRTSAFQRGSLTGPIMA